MKWRNCELVLKIRAKVVIFHWNKNYCSTENSIYINPSLSNLDSSLSLLVGALDIFEQNGGVFVLTSEENDLF